MSAPHDPHDPSALAQELLCLRCQRGERAAWGELVRQWERPLHYYIRRMTRSQDEALQVLQETWLQVFSSLPSLRDSSRLAAWLYTLARRAVMRHVGARSGGKEEESMEGHPEEEDPEDPHAHERAEWVHWGLDRLTPSQREVLVLFFLEDLSLREIGALLEIPSGTVKSRLSSARGALKSVLKKGELL